MQKAFSRRQFLNTSAGALVGSVMLADSSFAAPLFQQAEKAVSKLLSFAPQNVR